ncbi:MAG: hypothetical protein CSA81_07210 [Acidobacteria bacterium]|nr:MAG: hypothetical protein CSA81_07210 [Acidobacteriota bacterium]
MNRRSLFIIITLGICLLFLTLPGEEEPAGKKNAFAAEKSLPRRVICINPAATEIFYAMGCEDMLVAVSDYCTYPAGTAQKAKIGGIINPNLEKISALKPELVILQGKNEVISNFCELKGIECLHLDLRNLNEIYQGITKLGQRLGCSDAANKLCTEMKAEIHRVKLKASVAKKKSVFFALYRTPGSLASITTVGPNTFLSELIEIAGGINVFHDLQQDYSVVSKETLLKRQPDLILEPSNRAAQQDDSSARILQDWNKLQTLKAVQQGEIYLIDADMVLRPGPRVSQAALEMARLIHPELFDE